MEHKQIAGFFEKATSFAVCSLSWVVSKANGCQSNLKSNLKWLNFGRYFLSYSGLGRRLACELAILMCHPESILFWCSSVRLDSGPPRLTPLPRSQELSRSYAKLLRYLRIIANFRTERLPVKKAPNTIRLKFNHFFFSCKLCMSQTRWARDVWRLGR